ncbi:MAG: hypothetical protein AAGA90_07790 [Actinomycetota bacterium]
MTAGNEILDFRQVVLEVGMARNTVRRLFSDKGGPIYRLPGTGTRIKTTRAQLDAYKAGPSPAEPATSLAGEMSGRVVEVVAGPVFS